MEWGRHRELSVDLAKDRAFRFTANPTAPVFMVEMSSEFVATHEVLESFLSILPRQELTGGLFWLSQEGGAPESTGRDIMSRVLGSYGIADDVLSGAGRFDVGWLFDEEKPTDPLMMLALCYVFGWRATFVSASATTWVATMDAEWIYVSTADSAIEDRYRPLFDVYEAKVVDV
jgi:hypothetical protein